MLQPNNPDIDFDTLNRRIQDQLHTYQEQLGDNSIPLYEPAPEEQAPAAPHSLHQLYSLEGRQFIEHAFQTLLGRPADPQGLQHYLAQLLNGEEKSSIVAALAYSAEGRAHAAPTTSLKKAAIKRQLLRLPIIGPLCANLLAAGRLHRVIHALNGRLTRLAIEQDNLTGDAMVEKINQLSTTSQQLTKQIKYSNEQLASLQAQHLQLQQQHQQLQQQHQTQQQYSQAQIAQLKLRLNDSTTACPAPVSPPATSNAPAVEDALYMAFENHFRGDEKSIQQRLQHYLPLLSNNPTVAAQQQPIADIGCGRGEWLDLLKQQGYQPIGIDLNSHNIHSCQEKGHQACQADGLHWLQSQPANSLSALTSFHVIEHLSFEQYNQLLSEAMRVLAPGGLLILETPNPENLVTSSHHFYTDPTHRHPIPPALSEFMLDYRGFSDIQIHRLHPIPEEYALIEHGDVERHLNRLVYGPQDYAITGTKPILDHMESVK